jgi:hypothetical protein
MFQNCIGALDYLEYVHSTGWTNLVFDLEESGLDLIYLSQHLPIQANKNRKKTSVDVTSIQAAIRTEDVPNTCLEHYL